MARNHANIWGWQTPSTVHADWLRAALDAYPLRQ
jgi:hypothetical protein